MLWFMDRAYCTDLQCQHFNCDRLVTYQVLQDFDEVGLPMAKQDPVSFPECEKKKEI